MMKDHHQTTIMSGPSCSCYTVMLCHPHHLQSASPFILKSFPNSFSLIVAWLLCISPITHVFNCMNNVMHDLQDMSSRSVFFFFNDP